MKQYSEQMQLHADGGTRVMETGDQKEMNQKNAITQKSTTQENVVSFNTEDYSVFLSKAFTDLIDLAGEDAETFIELFYNRKQEYAEFQTIASNLYASGDNILVIGDAGIGKSNFIYRLFYEDDKLKENKLYPIMIDYRKIATDNKLTGMKLIFIEEMFKYFEDIDYALIPVGGGKIENIDDNLHHIQKGIANVAREKKKNKQPLVFIDDLDYAENDALFPILDFLAPYARTINVSILMCVRPPLYQVLCNNDSTYAILFAHTPRHINLRSMDLHSVLAMRLAPILTLNQNKKIIENIWERLTRVKSSQEKKYKNILKKLGVKNLDDLTEIVYPFTDSYINFMKKVTLEDLREMFTIATKSLVFILENYNNLTTIKEHEEVRKVISRQHIIDLFTPQDEYHLFNLHERINSKGNSLYFNVLEAIQLYESNLNPKFKISLKELGHAEEQIEEALTEMGYKRNRLLLQHNFNYAKDHLKKPVKYTITEKGIYYIQEISKWNEYKDKYKTSKNSIIEKYSYNETK
ncbi:MAG: hypothetical protein LBR10_11110 [Prevotellaceae bacterium]|nr:hypothetical protein [Prevotellaceae bacterium]